MKIMIKQVAFIALMTILSGVNVKAATTTVTSWRDLENALISNAGAGFTVNSCVLTTRRGKAYDFTSRLKSGADIGNLDLAICYNQSLNSKLPWESYKVFLDITMQGKRYVTSTNNMAFSINIGAGASVFAKAPYYQKIQSLTKKDLLAKLKNTTSQSVRIVAAQWTGAINNFDIKQSKYGTWDMTDDVQKQVNEGGSAVIPVSPFSDRSYHVESVFIMFIINNVVYQSNFNTSK